MQVPASIAYALADLLEGLETPQALSAAAFEIPGTAEFNVQALYLDEPILLNLSSIITPLFDALQLPVPQISLSPLENRDWVSESLRGLPPVIAGRFFVSGAHALSDAPRNAIRLHVEAGQAFGTGHHETTTGCLLALDQLARLNPARRKVLDLGCGSGVLAMAAAKLWRHKVAASDIDPLAVRVTRENAARNGLSALLHPVIAKGFAHPAIAAGAPYDLILANILARPLIRLAYPMSRHLAPGGYIVLSGLLISQEAAVRSAYRTQSLFLVRRFLRGGWSTLVLRKTDLK
jgi:ribosomal protein L11 methyltransferase